MGWIFWDKKITSSNNTNFSDGELAWSSFVCILRRFTYDWIGFGYLNNPQGEKKSHPTQKPVELFEYIIKTYTNEGDIVLDNVAGSGTTGEACINLNRDFILIEKVPNYYEVIKKRVGKIFKNYGIDLQPLLNEQM